jgi:hypothetical protein
MKKLLFLLFISSFSLLNQTAVAQNNVVNVNPLTGSAGVMIPIYQIGKGSVSVPINLIYNGTGVKPKDVEGSAGIGWYISTGGQVSRQLRGLPDDCNEDIAGYKGLGWLYNNNGTSISNFTITNDNNAANCADEVTDINYINANFIGYTDTEPDIFNVSAPGLSCQLVLDKNHVFRTLSYQDLKIEYSVGNPAIGDINSFTITNDKGVKYVFDQRDYAYREAVPTTGTPVNYFASLYKQYQASKSFCYNWYLSSITDVNGNKVTLTYADGGDRHSVDPVELFIGGSTVKSTQYSLKERYVKKVISSISNGTDQLVFHWEPNYYTNGGTDMSLITSISGMGREFQFTYSNVSFQRSSYYVRNFLRQVNDSGCSSPVQYSFTYYGETPTGNNNYTTTLSDSSSTFRDYWGYQNTNNTTSLIPAVFVNPLNPAIPRYTNFTNPGLVGPDYAFGVGENAKYVDPTTIASGSLQTMKNANGGTTTLVYQPNDYLDAPSNSIFPGGGVRVKSITDNDGLGNNMIRNYSYQDPATGKSSGKALTLPVYAFSIPYAGTATGKIYWDNATVLSVNDLSEDDHTVMYQYCRESKTGAGSTLYQYYVPATVWDNSATPGCASCNTTEWAPTKIYMGKSSCLPYSPVKNDIYTYPFPPAANYDFERGLVRKVTSYNDAGTPVSESEYTYQRTGQPLVIPALKFDDNNGVMAYAKYNIYTMTSELTSQVTKKVFDSPTLSKAQASTTNYTYDNTYHQMIKQQTTNSDNSIVSVNAAYSKNYTIAGPSADSTASAIYYLQAQNVNIPIETYTQVTRAGETKTINAQLTKFKRFTLSGGIYGYLPFQSLKMVSPDGTAFTPFTVAGGVATNDPKYIPVTNYTAYDNTGKLQSADDNYRHVQTGITDRSSGQTVAQFKNAAVKEIGFEDFDSSLPAGTNFRVSVPTGIVATNSHTGNSYTLNTGQSLSKFMSRKAGENYYVLSAWISSSVAGNISLILTNSSNVPTTYSEPFTNTGGTSKYFEWKVPVGNMTPVFTISLSSGQQIYIDDIIFYPQSAEVAVFAYDPIAHFKIAETNTNGVSSYYVNDKFCRLLITYYKDKNIKKRKSYLNVDYIEKGVLNTKISTVPNYNDVRIDVNTVISMDAYHNPCLTDVTYRWDFGDGMVINVLNGYHQSHTYTSVGVFHVTCTVSSPSFSNTKSDLQDLTIKYPDLHPELCQSGVTIWDNCFHKAVSQVSCAPNPNDDSTTYYAIRAVGGSGYGALHYEWQLTYDDGTTWVREGTDSNQFSKPCFGKNQAYMIRCVVTSDVRQTGTTDTDYFHVQGECQ